MARRIKKKQKNRVIAVHLNRGAWRIWSTATGFVMILKTSRNFRNSSSNYLVTIGESRIHWKPFKFHHGAICYIFAPCKRIAVELHYGEDEWTKRLQNSFILEDRSENIVGFQSSVAEYKMDPSKFYDFSLIFKKIFLKFKKNSLSILRIIFQRFHNNASIDSSLFEHFIEVTVLKESCGRYFRFWRYEICIIYRICKIQH